MSAQPVELTVTHINRKTGEVRGTVDAVELVELQMELSAMVTEEVTPEGEPGLAFAGAPALHATLRALVDALPRCMWVEPVTTPLQADGSVRLPTAEDWARQPQCKRAGTHVWCNEDGAAVYECDEHHEDGEELTSAPALRAALELLGDA